MPTTGLVQADVAGRAVERRIEGEDPPVGGDQPVAPARMGGHADDRLGQVDGAGRAVEVGPSVGEDAAVGGHQPVAAAGVGGHADDRLGQLARPPPIRCSVPRRRGTRRRRWPRSNTRRRRRARPCPPRPAGPTIVARPGTGRNGWRWRRRWHWPAAGRVEQVRRRAGHHPAGDAAHAGHVLMALPVAELGAAGVAVVAVAEGAAAGQAVAGRAAEPARAAADVQWHCGVAVDVVTGPGAVDRAVRLPPAAGEGTGRTGVDAVVDGAAELGVAVAAGRPAVAVLARAGADGGVGAHRLQGEVDRGDRQRGGGHGRTLQEAPPGGPSWPERWTSALPAIDSTGASEREKEQQVGEVARRRRPARGGGRPARGWWANALGSDRAGAVATAVATTAAPRLMATCSRLGGVSGLPKQPHDEMGVPRTRASTMKALKAR